MKIGMGRIAWVAMGTALLAMAAHSGEVKALAAADSSKPGTASASAKAVPPEVKADAEADRKARSQAEAKRVEARIKDLKEEVKKASKEREAGKIPAPTEKGKIFISNEKSPAEKAAGL
jgi:hypothetical protein